MISSYHVDIAVLSCKGLDMTLGITDSNENDSLIKQAMLASAERRVLALDSEKFDKKSFVKVCGTNDVDIIVTDSEPPEKWIGFCNENNIELVY
jgi:DeoR/GlpR family transcriptional regulator of sugar metabolism